MQEQGGKIPEPPGDKEQPGPGETSPSCDAMDYPNLWRPKNLIDTGDHFTWVNAARLVGRQMALYHAKRPNLPATAFGSVSLINRPRATGHYRKFRRNSCTMTPNPSITNIQEFACTSAPADFVRRFVEYSAEWHKYDIRRVIDLNGMSEPITHEHYLHSASWFGAYFIPKDPTACAHDSITWPLQYPKKSFPPALTPHSAWVFMCYRDHTSCDCVGACISDLNGFSFLPPEMTQLHHYYDLLMSLNFGPVDYGEP